MSQPATYEFGRFRVDAGQRQLFREGKPVPLTLKAFDTLLVLVARSGQVVEKEELLSQIWPDAFVEENTLTTNISTLRKVLE
ncbi:MAG TPA: winged helix-turn-helix domain-containing protein, partial [Blastocatellia bacterium]|nr:winged helix-turn-helix domain-containing protein [Blastocatellia bacterium]